MRAFPRNTSAWRPRLAARPSAGVTPENSARLGDDGPPRVWIVSTVAPRSDLGFEVRQVFASEHSAVYHIEEQYGVVPVLDETGTWNGSAALGAPCEIAIQRFTVES